MTYVPPPPPLGKPKRKLGVWGILGIIVAVVIALCACGGIISAVAGVDSGSGKKSPIITTTTTPDPSVRPSTAAAAKTPAVQKRKALTADDIELKVKTKSKTCFGSAGCNVEFSILATVSPNVDITDSCEVTYEVHGLEDPQTNTLTIEDNDSYRQDRFQYGSTSSSSKKLTAKVTDVVCG